MRATVERTRACTTSSVSSSSSKTTTSFTLRTPRFRSSPSATISRITIGEREIAFSTRICPRSMRLAISTSPSRVSSGTVPISRRYMRTGSLVFSSVPGRQIKLDVFALFELKILVGAKLRRVQQIDALGADRRHQIVDVVGRSADVLRQHVIHVAVGQIALLLAGIDQVCDVVFEFVVDGQNGSYSPARSSFSTGSRASAELRSARNKIWMPKPAHIADTDSRPPHKKSGLNNRSEQDGRASGFAWVAREPKLICGAERARILTEINRLTQLIPPLNREISSPDSSAGNRQFPPVETPDRANCLVCPAVSCII